MFVKQLDERNFAEKLSAARQPVLIDFYADWCSPCRAPAPVLEELAASHDDKVEIAKVNIDHNRSLAQKYGVRGVPTMIVFKNGEEADRVVGFLPKQELDRYLSSLA